MCAADKALGLLGGTFDPVHFGHLRVAIELAESLALDQVSLLPCFQPPHRQQPQAGAAERKQMLQLAVAEQSRLTVDDRELRRGGYSYTVDTLQGLRDEQGDKVPIYFAMGLDAFNGLPDWNNWQCLFELANIVVMSRPGYRADPAHPALAGRERHFTGHETAAGALYQLSVTPLNISATAIRRYRAQNRCISYLLPHSVERFIHQHRLYQ